MPLFPRGICGAITHTTDYCAATVADTGAYASVGIDAEVLRPLNPGVVNLTTLPEERTALTRMPEIPGVSWPVVLFSAKEAFFKCYFPLFRHYIDFTHARVELSSSGVFVIEPFADAVDSRMRSRQFMGHFSIDGGLVRSAIVIEASEDWPSI
jgi:4'-phosphopantetheinyl transferase EntD